MVEKKFSQNYLFTLVKLLLFLLVLCFAISLTKEFLKEVKIDKDFNFNIFIFSILFCFIFYIFFIDLNSVYKKVQSFFFHSSFLYFVLPSFFILLGIGFFLIPKIFNLGFSSDLFLFFGGFFLTVHLIFIAKELKEESFAGFVNYLFIFSILYILNLFLFNIYLKIAFKINLGKIFIDGLKGGAVLIKDFFIEILR